MSHQVSLFILNVEDFSVEEHQLDAKNKDLNYIQNYIFITKDT